MKEITWKDLEVLYEYIRREIPAENYRAINSNDEVMQLYGNKVILALWAQGWPCMYDARRKVIFFPSTGYLSGIDRVNHAKALLAIAHEIGHYLSHNNSKRAQELINKDKHSRTDAEREEIEALADEEASKLLKRLGFTERYQEIKAQLKWG